MSEKKFLVEFAFPQNTDLPKIIQEDILSINDLIWPNLNH